MKKILRTTKGCPIISLYLQLGQTPARFEILKMKLLYLKTILEEPDESSVRKMFNLQLENPTVGDWASSCLSDLKYINVNLTLEEIRKIPKEKYTGILKEKTRETALKYLLAKQGKKGSEISYSCLEMAEYLLPHNSVINVEEKCEMFGVKNGMTEIPYNFSSNSQTKCVCGKLEDNLHIYKCELYNVKQQATIPFMKIFNGNLSQQNEVFTNLSKYGYKRKDEDKLPM